MPRHFVSIGAGSLHTRVEQMRARGWDDPAAIAVELGAALADVQDICTAQDAHAAEPAKRTRAKNSPAP